MFALLAGMLLAEGVPYSELARRVLVLTEHNCDQVAQVIEWCLSPLSNDIGVGEQLRRRLRELEGITVMLLQRPGSAFDAENERS